MYGLPGSGKTIKAMELFNKLSNETRRYSGERVSYLNLDKKDFCETSNISPYGNSTIHHLIIDGFFKSTSDLYIRITKDYGLSFADIRKFTIYEFDQDIQKCLSNDKKRNRNDLAVSSITSGIPPFNINEFKDLFHTDRRYVPEEIKIIKVPVVDWSEKDDYTLYSNWKWDHDDIKDGFIELDNFLEKNYPDISFLKYKKLQKKINVEEYDSSDYYDDKMTTSLRWSIKYSDILEVINS